MRKSILTAILVVGSAIFASQEASAANVLWVSDNPAAGFSGPGSGTTFSDQGFITLLQGAGHTVSRYNPPDSGTMTAADLSQIGTFDLVILGRAIGSGAFQATAQAAQWNTINKPLLSMNAYLSRASRLGWFENSNLNDGTPTQLTVTNPSDPETAFLFGGVAMNGNITVNPYDEARDRNTSHIIDQPVSGGRVLATGTYVPLGSTNSATAIVLAEWDAGTVVRAGADTLGGYRLYYAGGSREPSGSPTNAGFENFTATGESIFLQAVTLAANSGVVPEPSTIALLVIGGLSLLAVRARKS